MAERATFGYFDAAKDALGMFAGNLWYSPKESLAEGADVAVTAAVAATPVGSVLPAALNAVGPVVTAAGGVLDPLGLVRGVLKIGLLPLVLLAVGLWLFGPMLARALVGVLKEAVA